MPDTTHLLDRARRRAPEPRFDLEDVRRRRERRERGRRVRAGALGVAITVGLLVAAVNAVGSLGGDPAVGTRDGGTGLPVATRPAGGLTPGEYSYQRILIYEACPTDLAPDSGCATTRLRAEAWWALDDSGRREALENHGYGFDDTGRFGPGEFPDEGDLSAFPIDPDALEAFLLDRSSSDGASPRPDVTPAPGVPLEEGLVWNSVRDYLGSTQYLNATPALRAAMLRVLATVPMVRVDVRQTDPSGRPAIALRFRAYDADHEVFVDPATGDFLAHTERYDDVDAVWVTLVEEAGFATSDDTQPKDDAHTVSPG
jgi:hypothetical protein